MAGGVQILKKTMFQNDTDDLKIMPISNFRTISLWALMKSQTYLKTYCLLAGSQSNNQKKKLNEFEVRLER